MKKEEYIRNLFALLRNGKNCKWILPEYTEEKDKFISWVSGCVLGYEMSDLVYDVALGQCDCVTYKGEVYSIKTVDELIFFLKKADLLEK